MAQCQICGQETNNKRRKIDDNLRLCDNCRASVLASRRREAEWEAQTGNPNFQHGYDANCPYCLRDIEHSDQVHEAALARNRAGSITDA